MGYSGMPMDSIRSRRLMTAGQTAARTFKWWPALFLLLPLGMFLYVFIMPGVRGLVNHFQLGDQPALTTATLTDYPRSLTDMGSIYRVAFTYTAQMPDGTEQTFDAYDIYQISMGQVPSINSSIDVLYNPENPAIVRARDHIIASDLMGLSCMGVVAFMFGLVVLAAYLQKRYNLDLRDPEALAEQMRTLDTPSA